MTTIGYATLQLIPSLQGVSESVNKQLGFLPGMGKKAGQQLGDGIAAGIKQAESAVKKSTDAIVKLQDKQADAVGKVRVAEQKLQELRDKGVTGGRLAAAEEARNKAYRGQASTLRDVESETRSLTRAQKELADASNNVGRNLGGAGGLKGFTSGITSQLNGLTGRFNSIGSGAGSGFAAGAIAAIAAGGFIAAGVKAAQLVASGFESVVTAGVGFDKTFNNFQAVTGSSTSQMAKFRQEAIALGGDTQLAGVNASDAATAMTELAKAGFTVEQAMAGARGTLQLAAAAQISAAEAATIEGNALNAFGLNADSAGKAADILANVANASSGEMTDFAYGLQAGGTVAHQFGLTIDDTATALGLLANSGIKGSDAGTLLKTSLLALTDQGKPAQGAIKDLGLTVYDASGNFEGMRALFLQLQEASKRMTPEMYQAATSVLFGSDAARLSGIAAEQGSAGWDKMATAVAKQGTAAQVSATQNQGLPGVIANIQNSVDTMKLSLYDMISQLLTIGGGEGLKGLQSVADWMNGHKPEMIQFFSDIVQAAVVFGEMIAMQASVTLRSFALIAQGIGQTAELVGTGLSKLSAPLQHIPDFLLGPGLAAVKHFGQEGGAALTNFGEGSFRVAGEMNAVGAAAGHLATDTLPALGDKLQSVADKAIHAEEQNRLYSQSFKQIQAAIEQVPGSKDFVLKDNSPEVQEKLKQLGFTVTHLPDGRLTVRLEYRDQNGQLIDPSQLNAPVRAPAVPGDPYRGPGRAYGGPITGPGGPKSDIIPIWASHGEHMLTASDVQAMGGQGGVYAFRNMLHRAGGGFIPMANVSGASGPAGPWTDDLRGKRVGGGKYYPPRWWPWAIPGIKEGSGTPIPWWLFPGGKPPSFAGGGGIKMAVPWGVDPRGGQDGGPSAGPFRPWWDMDWTPPNHPERVGPGKGWWWFHGPTHEKGIAGGPLGPPLGRHRKPLPGDFVPGMIPDTRIKRWGFAGGGAIGPDVSAAEKLVGHPYSQGSRFDCCLVGSTMVFGPHGAKPISELNAGDEVYSFSDRKAVANKVVAAWQSVTQPVFKVRTRNRSVVASANHPFMVVRKVREKVMLTGQGRGAASLSEFGVEWTRLDELQRGDLLVQPRALELRDVDAKLSDGTTVTEDVAWLLGTIIGDGTVAKRDAMSKSVRLCLFGERRDRATQIVRDTWGVPVRYTDSAGLMFNKAPLVDALLDMGYEHRGDHKRMPAAVWAWGEKLQRAFLDGYCDADGHRPKNVMRHGERSYHSSSRRLINDVRTLHMMLGDPVSNVAVNKRTKPIVIKGKLVHNALPLHSFAVSMWHPNYGEGRLRSYNRGLAQWLDDNDFTASKVLGITDEGIADTYDIEVESNHNFIADGVVVHNSGDVARVINAALGMGGGLMSTKTAKEWLAARGFVPGTGGPGQISVGWYDHGPNPNDGHMAMTLSDGRPAEGGGSVGVFTVGAGASGASNPQFDQHMFLPTIYGEGPAGPSSASPFAGGSAAAAVTGGGTAAPPSSSAPTGGGGGSSFSLPSSISGLASFGLDDLGKGVGTTGSGSDLSLFGKAAGSAVSGQVDSLLGVFGVPGTPGWLKAASMLVSGIKVGGGSSAAPLSATPTISGTPPPDDPGNMHGGRAGQPPGPQTVYNIRTATVEDAFLAAQRKQNERNAAKLSRF